MDAESFQEERVYFYWMCNHTICLQSVKIELFHQYHETVRKARNGLWYIITTYHEIPSIYCVARKTRGVVCKSIDIRWILITGSLRFDDAPVYVYSLPWRYLDLKLTPTENYDVTWNPRIVSFFFAGFSTGRIFPHIQLKYFISTALKHFKTKFKFEFWAWTARYGTHLYFSCNHAPFNIPSAHVFIRLWLANWYYIRHHLEYTNIHICID